MAFAESSPENLDLPASMNCRVAVSAIDLIIREAYYASRSTSTGKPQIFFHSGMRFPRNAPIPSFASSANMLSTIVAMAMS